MTLTPRTDRPGAGPRWGSAPTPQEGAPHGVIPGIPTRVTVLAIALTLSLNPLPRSATLGLSLMGFFIVAMNQPVADTLVALAVCGLFFLALMKDGFGISATVLILLQLLVTVLLLEVRRFRVGTEGGHGYRTEVRLLIWVVLWFTLFFTQFVVGPGTDFSVFQAKYFFAYAPFYIATGWLVSRSGVTVEGILLPAAFFVALMFPLLGVSILGLPAASTVQQYGLRGVEGYGAIAHDRVAAQAIVVAFIALAGAREWRRVLPEVVVILLLASPVVWFSYTRQSILGAVVGVGLVVTRLLWKGTDVGGRWRVTALVGLLFVSVAVGVKWLAGGAVASGMTRFGSLGLFEFQDESSGLRVDLWRKAIDYISIKPVTGYGLGGFGDLYAGGRGAWPHNWFLEAWLEFGILGFALALIAAAALVRAYVRAEDWGTAGWAVLGLFWLFLVQVSGNIPNNSSILTFVTVAALGRGTCVQRTARPQQFAPRRPCA